jgi:DNA-directed RNA polymerase subunit RPC12/RpoP
VSIKDIRKKSYENWNHYKYEDYNTCPYCGGNIHMEGSVNEYQRFRCLVCETEFVLNAITEEIKLQ